MLVQKNAEFFARELFTVFALYFAWIYVHSICYNYRENMVR